MSNCSSVTRWFPGVVFCLLLAACHNRNTPAAVPERHLASAARPGAGLYIDRVDIRVVMQTDSSTPNNFCSFRIGWADSTTGTDKVKALEKERYFQYAIQNDWKALAGGDTLKAVFFQEKPALGGLLKEGVMVFEMNQGQQPDTLIYRDSFGAWGTQIFVLNRNK
jgi:hypothetical protein